MTKTNIQRQKGMLFHIIRVSSCWTIHQKPKANPLDTIDLRLFLFSDRTKSDPMYILIVFIIFSVFYDEPKQQGYD